MHEEGTNFFLMSASQQTRDSSPTLVSLIFCISPLSSEGINPEYGLMVGFEMKKFPPCSQQIPSSW
jgi:hypothetical protein